MKLTTSKQMQALDRRSMEEYGIPGIVLMENAALRTAMVLREKYNHLLEQKVFLFCGKGNNGGDGLAIARHLSNRGHEVKILLLADPESLRGDAAVNLDIAQKMDLPIQTVTTQEGLLSLSGSIHGKGLVIDAIFGAGLAKPVTGFFKEAIDFINGLPNPVLSVDIPSGLNADTGRVDGPCIHAHITVTFALPKRAHFITPASTFVGRLEVVDISIPRKLMEEIETGVESMEREEISSLLCPLPQDSHKGNFGHLVVVGGSEGKGGAPAMAALSGLRTGVGLVTLALPQKIQQSSETGLLEVMSLPLQETEDGSIAEGAAKKFLSFVHGKAAVAIGPGIGTHVETGKFFREVVKNISCPLVIDADGLNLLARDKDLLTDLKGRAVLTPHPGEMARLMGISTNEVQARRLEVALEFADKTGCVVVLKGAGTLIATPEGKAFVNTTGNPGMATAGTGDALTGMIGSFLAQGHDFENAAKIGVFLHGLAGDIATQELGERSLMASDLIQALPMAFQDLYKTGNQ
jgi:NAD(P)H-hydrate epimerase